MAKVNSTMGPYHGPHALSPFQFVRVTAEQVDRTLQRGLVVVYALATFAGLAAIIYQPPSLLEVIDPLSIRIWAVYLLGGGAMCLAGSLIPRGRFGDWVGEYVGLWLLITAVAFYAAVAAGTIGGTPGRIPGVALLGGFAVLLLVRWLRVHHDSRKEPSPRRRTRT